MMSLKGTVSRDFRPSVFSSIKPTYRPLINTAVILNQLCEDLSSFKGKIQQKYFIGKYNRWVRLVKKSGRESHDTAPLSDIME
jgi:hypothetical protein